MVSDETTRWDVARPPRQDYVPLMIEAARRRLLAGNEVRITDIAGELGVSAPLVHYYFRDRQELVDAAWREILYAFVAEDQQQILDAAPSNDWDGVRALVDRVFAPHRDHVHVAHLRAAVEALTSQELATTVDDVHEGTIAEWRALVHEAIDRGYAETPLDTRALALLIVAVPLGVTAVRPDLAPSDRLAVAEAWTTMLRAVLDPSFQVLFPSRDTAATPDTEVGEVEIGVEGGERP